MNYKKEYILKLLDMLKDSLPLARWLIILIKNSDVDENLLDILIKSFQDSIDSITDENVKSQLKKWKEFLEEIKKRELDSKKLDEEDIAKLDDMLSKM
jgi:uncharacterized protein YecA (UPF0149 family)